MGEGERRSAQLTGEFGGGGGAPLPVMSSASISFCAEDVCGRATSDCPPLPHLYALKNCTTASTGLSEPGCSASVCEWVCGGAERLRGQNTLTVKTR